MSRPSEVFKLNTFELPRRAGEMKEYELDIEVPENFGVPLIYVPAGEVIEVDARLESVTEGILLSAEIFATAKGECTRCLDPVELRIEKKIQELYNYTAKVGRSKKAAVGSWRGAGSSPIIQRAFSSIDVTVRRTESKLH